MRGKINHNRLEKELLSHLADLLISRFIPSQSSQLLRASARTTQNCRFRTLSSPTTSNQQPATNSRRFSIFSSFFLNFFSNHSPVGHRRPSAPTTSNQQPATNTCRFTLIEMLVALALGVIILAVAVTAFQQGGAVSMVSHAKTEAVHNARVALQMLERDLEQAYLDPTGERFVGIDGQYDWNNDGDYSDEDDGDGDILSLYSLSEQGGTSPGTEITYSLNRNLTDLRTSQRVDLPCLSRNDGTPSSVGDGVRSFNVRYYYNDDNSSTEDWYDNWDSTDDSYRDNNNDGYNDGPIQYRRLPQIVEVTIEVIDSDGVLAKDDQNPVQIRRLIELPK